MFCHVCASNKLVIGGTLLPQKKSQKRTWRPPDGTSENKIDHVVTSRTWRSSLQDSRVKYNADEGSNHLLGVTEVNTALTGSQTKLRGRSLSLNWPAGTIPSTTDQMMKRQSWMLSTSEPRSKHLERPEEAVRL